MDGAFRQKQEGQDAPDLPAARAWRFASIDLDPWPAEQMDRDRGSLPFAPSGWCPLTGDGRSVCPRAPFDKL